MTTLLLAMLLNYRVSLELLDLLVTSKLDKIWIESYIVSALYGI